MSLQLLRRGLRLPSTLAQPARGITAKPPPRSCRTRGKNILALPSLIQESFIAFSTFFVTFMVPSGWILANMESYKSRG
ncbi:hypothetical protein lerEdw1_007320 [Lerista edwardsae]|nr:hypothetical protein lerEdw1_007320 [Lerista edwardsae]